MQIQTQNGFVPVRLYSGSRAERAPAMVTGTNPDLKHADTIELGSAVPRQLPEEAIKHGTARMFFGSEINSSLDRVLDGKSPEIADAAYRIIGSNLFADSLDLSEEDRAALLESGLSQAKYLADNYMSEEEGKIFMRTIHLLAAAAKTGKADIAAGRIVFDDFPQKPAGAPDDYIRPEELMKLHDPAGYAAMREAFAAGNAEGGLSRLLQFVKTAKAHPEWSKVVLEQQKTRMDDLRNAVIENRYKDAPTNGGIDAFVKSMEERMGASPIAELLKQNLQTFVNMLP